MNPDLYPYMGYDDEVACFPMYDFSGLMTGFNQYRPGGPKKVQNAKEGRYWTYVTPERLSVFGLESLHFSRDIFLVGGLFKAATLHRLGYTALHVSSAAPKLLHPQLKALGRRYFSIGDNDDEGRTFVARYGGWQSPVDVDEMSDGAVRAMITHEVMRLTNDM